MFGPLGTGDATLSKLFKGLDTVGDDFVEVRSLSNVPKDRSIALGCGDLASASGHSLDHLWAKQNDVLVVVLHPLLKIRTPGQSVSLTH